MTEDKKKSPNHFTIFSGDGTRVLHEYDESKSSETIFSGDGKRVLHKRKNNEQQQA